MKGKIAVAFGIVLRKSRIERKLSQEGLALEAGIARNYISLLELGQNTPSLEKMVVLCRALKIPLEDFILIFVKELKKISDDADEEWS